MPPVAGALVRGVCGATLASALPRSCVPSADGSRVPVSPSEGHAGADTAGCAPRGPGFPSAEELDLSQQWRGSVSTRRGGAWMRWAGRANTE